MGYLYIIHTDGTLSHPFFCYAVNWDRGSLTALYPFGRVTYPDVRSWAVWGV
jgi:hypothetical protein